MAELYLMGLLIILLILDGLACLVLALVIYTNQNFVMSLELKSLQERRLENLDKSIGYFGSRILKLTKMRDKASLLVTQTDANVPEFHDYCQRLNSIDTEIKTLRDVISYLKLC